MISREAQKLFDQLLEARRSNDAPFDLETERRNANGAGELAIAPQAILRREVSIANVRCLQLTPNHTQPKRIFIFVHGGAFGLMSPETHERMAGHIAIACEAETYMPDYSLAPEYPYPCALEQITDVVLEILNREGSDKQVVLIGESAGGSLALGASIRLRDSSSPLPKGLIFISPWLDLTLSGNSIQKNRDSDVMLTEEKLKIFANYYTQGTGFDCSHPDVSPLFYNLTHLPPTYCQAAGNDILLDDAVRLSEKMTLAGGSCKLKVYPGMCHSFQFFAGLFPETNAAINEIGTFVNEITI